jgi:hypothetical protein
MRDVPSSLCQLSHRVSFCNLCLSVGLFVVATIVIYNEVREKQLVVDQSFELHKNLPILIYFVPIRCCPGPELLFRA